MTSATGRAAAGLLAAAVAVAAVGLAPDGRPGAVALAAVLALVAGRWLPTPAALAVTGVAAVASGPLAALPGVPPGQLTSWLVTAAGLVTVCGLSLGIAADRRALHHAVLDARQDGQAQAQQAAAQHGELASQLQFWATHDPLTQLANRTLFTRGVADALAAGTGCGVLLVSLRGFTGINVSYGSAVGDEVLLTIGRRLEHAARSGDLVGRYGGDEFAVLLAGLPPADAQGAGDRLLRAFDDPVLAGGHRITVQARAGLAVAAPGEPGDALDLIARAEVATAAPADAGRVNLYAPQLQHTAAAQTQLEADLRRGLERGEFFCVYQPLVSTTDGRIASLEALVRWQHPERGLVPPDAFIGAAERSGLIVGLGLHVLDLACRQLHAWRQAGHGPLTIAVNVSARQLVEPGAVETVGQALWRSGVDPQHVVLELTESLLVDDDALVHRLWQLRGLGVRLAIDDFGTGYSSLSRLGNLPVQEMKIDKSFIDRLGGPDRTDTTAIVSAAVAMGRALGLTVVAEGVETEAQARFLAGIGCHLLQGYLLSRPVAAEQATALLDRVLLDPRAESVPAAPAAPAAPRVPGLVPNLAPAAPVQRLTAR